jgi:hypothetical protein
MEEGLSGFLTAMFPFGIIVLGIALAAVVFYWSRQRKSPGQVRRADRATEELYRAEEREAAREMQDVQRRSWPS